MKRIIILLGIVLLISGCTKRQELKTNSLIDDLQNIIYRGSLVLVKEKDIAKMYPINHRLVDEIVVLKSKDINNSDELVIIKTKEPAKVSDYLYLRVKVRKDEFMNYYPQEVSKLDRSIITIKGNYVILCVTNEAKKALEIIERY